MILQAGANGNIFAYNYSIDPFWTGTFFPANSTGEIVLHGNWPYANLLEGNEVGNIVIDNSHGANGPHNTFLRNRANGYGIFFSDTSSPSQHFIGNEITNDSLPAPFNSLTYLIQGSNHLIYGNNNLGVIDPLGTDTLSVLSYAYSSLPDFLPIVQWGSIGVPNSINSSNIPSKDRFRFNAIFSNSCGQNLTSNTIYNSKSVGVFPNPFIDRLNIEGSSIESIEVFDSYGRLNYHSTSCSSIENISWPKGIYILKVKSVDYEFFKLIKK
tara:strand:- start:6722 stop:7528 length:807 start_codon:yes stop_codon:yes gene_type:complete